MLVRLSLRLRYTICFRRYCGKFLYNMNIINQIKQFPIYNVFEQPGQYFTAFLISIVSAFIMFYQPESIDALNYQQALVSDGQWWRVFTANLCHSNWNHWTLNIVGLWLMDVWYKPVISLKIRNLLLFFCMFTNVALLHTFLDIGWYVGLSGALHGYLLGGAIISFATSKIVNSLIIVITTIKLIVENVWQINTETAELIGAEVLEEAHFFGAIAGLFFVAVFLVIHKKTT